MAIDYNALESTLLNASGEVPLAQRFRALFTLKSLASKDDQAIRVICKGRTHLEFQSRCTLCSRDLGSQASRTNRRF
jgi:hypothetical protein